MQKWEYEVVTFNVALLNEKLNHMGKDGWELAGVLQKHPNVGSSSDILCIFKKPIKQE